MASRYSNLKPFSPSELSVLSHLILLFFSLDLSTEDRIRLELPTPHMQPIQPYSLSQFLEWVKEKRGLDYDRRVVSIQHIVRRLVATGFLTPWGRAAAGFAVINHYFSMFEVSNRARRGTLILGEAFGAAYIGAQINESLVRVVGQTPVGDQSVGTAIHIHSEVLLTCAHVVTDMNIVGSELKVAGQSAIATKVDHSEFADVGLIWLNKPIQPKLKDLALRPSSVLEEIVIGGFPTIPQASESPASFQRGEISAKDVFSYGRNAPVDLFSAIARPGNSGGPIVALDGCIVGIVTRSVERPREEADAMAPLPFFAAVPAKVIREEVQKLAPQVTLPWEDYE